MESKGLTISWASLWRVLLMLVLASILFIARDILISLFLALVISSALDPIVSWLEKKKIPRLLSTLVLYIAMIFFLALVAYAVIPIALSEFNNFLTNIGKYSGTLFNVINASGLIESINQTLAKFTNLLLSGSTSLLDVGVKFLGGLSTVISVFMLSFYLTVGKDGVERFFVTILPAVYESKALGLYGRIKKKLGSWLAGQLVLSGIFSLLVFIGLSILGVKYSLLLGLLAGIMELVPFVGPIFSGSIAVLVAFTTSVQLAFYVLILFVILQQLEGNVLVAAVSKFSTDMDPVVVIVSILIGAKVFGIVGLILAVPAAVLLQEVVSDWSQIKARRRGLGL